MSPRQRRGGEPLRGPIAVPQQHRRPNSGGVRQDHPTHFRFLRAYGDRHARLQDTGLLGRNGFQGIAEQFAVVERYRGDGAGGRPLDHVGGIAASTQAHFEHAQFCGRPRKQVDRRGRDELEGGDRRACVDLLYPFERFRQPLIVDQSTADSDTLVVPHEVRRGIKVHPPSGCFRHGTDERARAALTVGAGYVDHRRQPALGVVELGQQGADPVEAEIDQLGMQAI